MVSRAEFHVRMAPIAHSPSVALAEPRASAAQPRVEGRPPCLRIGVFSYRLPVAGQKRGGIERVAHDLADGLGRRGHEVTVFSHDPRPPGAAYAVAGLPWRRFVDSWIGRRVTMGYLGNVLWLLPRVSGFDVLMTHGDSLLLPLKGKPFVRVMHGSAREEAASAISVGRRLMQAGVYVQELAGAALHTATVGVSANTRLANRFVRHVIPNGVDRRVFHPGAALRDDRPALVFVGTLGGRKRGAWLLDLFDTVIRPRVPRAELHMVCPRGPGRAGVTYYVGLADAALAALYCRAWLCVSPSTYEGFGLPYAEALACGTPVVATPNPGSHEVLATGGGVLASDEAFAATVVALLTDDLRRRALEDAARARAGDHDLEATLDAYEAVLLSLHRREGQTA
jgi:phosphatidyl-myo-inositol alpha-mannosyltransferase